jgi:hypothetical protein
MLVFFIVIAIALLIAILISTSSSSKETLAAPSPNTKYSHSRTITTNVANGGKSCPIMKESCVPKIDCLLNNTWGTCDPVTRKQTKEILRYPEGTGTACGATSQDCIPDINCVQSGWTTCDITGKQTRTTTTAASGNVAACGPLIQNCPAPPYNWGNSIKPGTIIYPNQYMRSSSGNRTFYLRADGNLLIFRDMPSVNGNDVQGSYTWASNTNGKGSGPYYLYFQESDGNLVLYANGAAIWSTGAAGTNGSHLDLQDDGNLVLYKASGNVGNVQYASGTNRKNLTNFSTDAMATTSLEYRGKCLDSSIDSTANPTGLGYSLNNCNGSLDQRFYIDTYSGHAYMLKSKSGKCMDAGRDGGATWYWTTTCDPANNNQNQFGKDSRGNMIGFKYQGSRCVDIGNNKLNWDCQSSNVNQQVTWHES